MMRFDMVLNQPDAGEISVNLNDPNALDITQGRLIKMVYRGAPIGSGGFFVENTVDDHATQGDKSGQWKRVSGRGGLAILDDAIVWSATDTSRTFTAKTMAYILLTLITEAKARGCFPSMRTEFSSTLDSNGDPWTDSTTITLQTGTSLLDVVRQFADLGLDFKLVFDWVLGDYALYAYGIAIGSDKSAGVVVQMGHNAEQLSETRESSALKNAYLVNYAAGMTSVTDATSISAYRRREAYFQAGNAPSSGSALVLANAELTARKDPTRTITVRLEDSVNSPRYGVDYDLGDWVGVDWCLGAAPEKFRIRGVTLEWDERKKYASITLTLNSIRLEQELKTAIAMRKIANGSLGGSTSSAPIGGDAAVDAHDADASAHSSRPLSGDLGGTLGAPVVAKIRGVAVKNPLTVSTRQVMQYNPTNSELEMGDTPAHASTHQSGGADAIKLDALAAPDDNTDLDVSTSTHGLCPKLPNDDTKFLNGTGRFSVPAGGSGGGSGGKYICNGRLTLESGVPVSTTSQANKTTLYYTPYLGDQIALYDSAWSTILFSETAISLSGLTASRYYDVFAYNSSGTIAFELVVWTSANLRATALATQNGVLVKSGDATHRYIGTIFVDASGYCQDTFTKKFVWNFYNQVERYLQTGTWNPHTYNGDYRKWGNSDSGNLLEFITGISTKINVYLYGIHYDTTANNLVIVRPYLNGNILGDQYARNVVPYSQCTFGFNNGYSAVGYNKIQAYEKGVSAGSNFNDVYYNCEFLG